MQVTRCVWLAAVEALRNFALIKSARLHMLKEGWLTQCAVLLASIHESERAKEQPAAVALVEFLANFTFAADGQVSCATAAMAARCCLHTVCLCTAGWLHESERDAF